MKPYAEPNVSIIIPAKNEEHNIGACLDAVFLQETSYSFEIVVIDSGSSDHTLDILKKYPTINVVEIPPSEFGHGKTRNLGAQIAHGYYIVFLNADALPVNKNWLDSLLNPFSSDPDVNVVGVYSRHIPKDDCDLYMVRDISKSMPDKPIIRTQLKALDFMIFSTVSCAIRRDIFMEFPFDNDIMIAEDQKWAGKMINQGFKIVYEPTSMVFHSHNYSPRQMAEIKFKIGIATMRFKTKFNAMTLGFLLMLGGIIVKVIGDIWFIFFTYKPAKPIPFTKKIKEVSTGFKSRTTAFWSRYKGWIHR